MIVHIDRAWLLDLAHKHLPRDPSVTDFGTLAAAVARHADKVMGTPVYTEPHHRAAALMHQLIRVPALEFANQLFAAVVAASYLTVSGAIVSVTPKEAVCLAARIEREALGVREAADEIRGWIAG
ncbi:fic family toxin-antitoxin system, toxin component [Streptomyces montanisoli]|uniref:Fic family toxin-antitoxin system, toxin component n=1 Tax=Streptomyces montanisoli TaxID=2798581 RepID=A0A940MCN9_9ACTN|nr:fic family toxin-antitoxin system, toxin component [Streptomyces montanisoli]MBP0458839.1 fic family toxin-antitoxin system, toxin component [Streptomyces montanisoli]